MSLIRKHGAVLQAWACLDLVFSKKSAADAQNYWAWPMGVAAVQV